MRSSTLMATLFGGLAIASPILRERKEVVELEVVTVVTTITAGSQPTPPPAPVQVVTVVPSAAPKQAEFFGLPTTKPVTPPAASTPPPSTGGGSPVGGAPASSAYSDVALWHHNIHRANHSAPAMTWSADLAASALTVAQTCVYAHKTDVNGGGYGQNIAAGAPPSQIGNIITDMMYNNEIGSYPGFGAEPSMDNFHEWGHFSQIVWVGSTEVGCATSHCGTLVNGGDGVDPYFTVCNYKTPGNYGGQYSKNVLAPKGAATVSAKNLPAAS